MNYQLVVAAWNAMLQTVLSKSMNGKLFESSIEKGVLIAYWPPSLAKLGLTRSSVVERVLTVTGEEDLNNERTVEIRPHPFS